MAAPTPAIFEPPAPETWAAGLPAPLEWADGLEELDDVPDFDVAANPEIDVNAHLPADRALIRRPTRRTFRDFRANPDAYKHLDPLPGPGESLHGVICGRYALWELVPAIIKRSGCGLLELYVATLGFSKSNAVEIIEMLDAGTIDRLSLLVSYYFQKTSQSIYDELVPALLKRGQRVLAMRTHCKMMLARTRRGSRYVCESSANLRSCKNIEQFVLTRDRPLYEFHRGWMEEELFARQERRQIA